MDESNSLLDICTQKTKKLVKDGPLKNSQEVTGEANHVVSTLITGDMTNTRRLSGAELKILVARGERLKKVARIVVENVTNEDILFIKKTIHGQGGPVDFGIADILKLIVLPTDGSAVRSLSIMNMPIDVYSAQMLRMAHLFPNLKTAELENMKLSSCAIKQLFTSLPGLEHLSFCRTTVKSLEGISNLQNLRVLVVCHNNFGSSQAIIEIFKLRKLQVLNLSGEFSPQPMGQNVSHFLNCNQTLPGLTLLDISSNIIDKDQLNKLITLHPNLQEMSLIMTPLETHPQLENSAVSLLTMENLETCTKSLKHYNQKGEWNIRMALTVIKKMCNYVVEEYELQSQDMLRNSFKAVLLCENPKLHVFAVKFVTELTMYRRHEMFNDGEFIAIIRALLMNWTAIWEEEAVEENIALIRLRFWQRIVTKRTLPLYVNYFETIMKRAVWTLKQARDMVFVGELDRSTGCAMAALHECIHKYKDDNNHAFKTLYDDNELKDCLLQFMDRLNNGTFPFREFNWMLVAVARKLFCEPNRHEESTRVPQATKTIATSIKCLGLVRDDDERQLDGLGRLNYILYISKLDYNMFFEEPQFSILTGLINSRKVIRLVAVYTFVVLRTLTEGWDRKQLYQSKKAWSELSSEIIKDVKKYEGSQPAADSLTLFKWLSENGTESTTTFANWMLKHFEDEEGPSTKRRRIAQ